MVSFIFYSFLDSLFFVDFYLRFLVLDHCVVLCIFKCQVFLLLFHFEVRLILECSFLLYCKNFCFFSFLLFFYFGLI